MRTVPPSRDETTEFENNVRDVARALWPTAQYSGAVNVAGRERDGIFETDDVVNCVEATVSRGTRKAKEDSDKLLDLRRRRTGDKPVVLWLITREEPTSDQKGAVGRGVHILSFHEFRGRLINVRRYLDLRAKYPFGSARDPETGNATSYDEYIRVNLLSGEAAGSSTKVDLDQIVIDITDARGVVLLGDYGAGKSMTMREVFRKLAATARTSHSMRFPIHLNLRDHIGQSDAAEALVRHATRVGYEPTTALVSAWRAGYCHLLLDGFDEIARPGWGATPLHLREVRHRSMELVRVFMRESPAGTGVMISGRAHYFDTPREMNSALQLPSKARQVSIDGMTDAQVDEYMRSKGWTDRLPTWVPRRPLLLGYLAARGLLREVAAIPSATPQAVAWDRLLTLVAEREAEIDSNIRPETVRHVLERIVSIAREQSDRLGQIYAEDVTRAFAEVVGRPADEGALLLLQRLPGLGPTNADDGTRVVVDEELADCASAGDVLRFAAAPFEDASAKLIRPWRAQLQPLGIGAAAVQWERLQRDPGVLAHAIRKASEIGGAAMAADLLLLAIEVGAVVDEPRRPIVITGVYYPTLDLADPPSLSGVVIRDSLVDELELPTDAAADSALPAFESCEIGTLFGRFGAGDLPAGRFSDTSVSQYSASDGTTAAIMASHLSPGVRVTLSILRKVYMQAGGGRKEGALIRGLKPEDRSFVGPVLDLLVRHELAWRGTTARQTIWLPFRSEQGRVQGLLDAPTTSTDKVVVEARNLQNR